MLCPAYRWSATTSPALQPKSLGNAGALVFQVGGGEQGPSAELALVWQCPYVLPSMRTKLSDAQPTVGFHVGPPHSFSMMTNDAVRSPTAVTSRNYCRHPPLRDTHPS
jgi:hypothetical protein